MNDPADFDEAALVRQLDALPVTCRVAFSAACAERLMPAYLRRATLQGTKDGVELAAALARLWEDLEGKRMTQPEVASAIGRCTGLIPPDDEVPWTIDLPAASDAASALVYALQCREKGSSRLAAFAGRRCYEAVAYRFELLCMPPGSPPPLLPPEPVARMIEAELGRQARDLLDLATAASPREGARLLRTRAREEAALLLSRGQ